MSVEMLITTGELQALVQEVQETKHARTVHLAEGVVAIVKPEMRGALQKARRRTVQETTLPTTYTLETAFGAVPTRNHPEDFERMIQDVKEERAERVLKNS